MTKEWLLVEVLEARRPYTYQDAIVLLQEPAYCLKEMRRM